MGENADNSDAMNKKPNRRKFLKIGLTGAGAAALGAAGLQIARSDDNNSDTGQKATVFNREGKVFTVDKSNLCEYKAPPVTDTEARKGIAGKKFVLVFDLAKCDGCKKCTECCQAMHFTEPDREWIKVFKMQDAETTIPYFFPKPCFHCDNPPCTKVCPVNATFKRQDGIVLIDNERCIGCRSCMAACPYSTRFFNWDRPVQPPEVKSIAYSPEHGFPRRIGTVEKCDLCPHMIRQGKMPSCVSGCPMQAIWCGDQNENAVTNSAGETVKLSQLLEDNAGYRHLEELGTEPRVYYLPPKNRRYPKPDVNEQEQLKKVKEGERNFGNMQM